MPWAYLVLAIVLEVVGTVTLKLSDGFTRGLPAATTVVCYVFSVVAMAAALKNMEVGVAYAVWSALGTALIATVGILWFQEPATAMKLISIGVIIIGVVFLNLSMAY